MGKSHTDPNFFNQEQFDFWNILKEQDNQDTIKKTKYLFSLLNPIEETLRKDVLDFTQEELIETFITLSLYTYRNRKDNLIYINKYARYMNKPELSLPGEADFKKLYAERGKFDVVFNEVELFSAMMAALKRTNHQDIHYYDMSILRQLMLYYGVDDDQLLLIRKDFINDFKLPTGETVSNQDIKDFIIQAVMNGGYYNVGKGDKKIYRTYIDADFLLSRSRYVSQLSNTQDKSRKGCSEAPRKNLLKDLRTQFEELYADDVRLTSKNIKRAGVFNRAYQIDMSNGNKEVVLTNHLLKQRKRFAEMELLEEERYNVYKLHRQIYNI